VIEEFHDDEPRYAAWLRDHPDGFVFNHFGGSDPAYNVIHPSACPHLHRAGDEGRRTVYAKLCSPDLAELERKLRALRGPGGWVRCGRCP
jgi:hypothetical protein